MFDSNRIEEATALLEDNPILKRIIINADNMNQLRDAVIALERFYYSDIQKYIINLVNFRGDFILTTQYRKFDVVNYVYYGTAIQSYMAIKDDIPIGVLPTNRDYFVPITLQGAEGKSGTGLTYRGRYDPNANYVAKKECVTYNNTLWVAEEDSINMTPSETSNYWSAVIKIIADNKYLALNMTYLTTTNGKDRFLATLPYYFTLEPNSTFLLNFDKNNTTNVEVTFDGIYHIPLKKIVDGEKVDFVADDIKEDIDYLFKYNGTTMNLVGGTNSVATELLFGSVRAANNDIVAERPKAPAAAAHAGTANGIYANADHVHEGQLGIIILQAIAPTGAFNTLWINSTTGVGYYWTGSVWNPLNSVYA